MKVFKVNNLITLRLIEGKTILFVNNREFKQCRILLLNLPGGGETAEEMNSIDEIADNLNYRREHEREYVTIADITEEEEFMGHCSNLQAWVENFYDTTLLHRNLAFPLLKVLSKEGDKIAEQRFKEEIGIRFKEGNETVQLFLSEESYLDYLTNGDILNGVLEPENSFFMERVYNTGLNYSLIPRFDFIDENDRYDQLYFSVKLGRIREIELEVNEKFSYIPSEIEHLKCLDRLHIYIEGHSENIFSKKL